LLEIGDRQLAAEIAVPALEIASRERASPLCEALEVRQLPEADARGDVGEVELSAGHLDVHAVFAGADHALQPQLLAARREALVGQDQGAALGAGDVLVGMEAEGDEIAEAAERLAAPVSAERLRGVLDDAQLMAPRDDVEPIAIDRQPGQIDRENGARL